MITPNTGDRGRRIGAIDRRRALLGLPALFGLAPMALPGRRLRADEEATKDESAARLAVMRRIARSIKLTELIEGTPGPAIAPRAEPLLRYDDPPRNMHDATLWAWGDRGRPAAALKVELYPPHPPARRWVLGLVALSTNRIAVEFHDGQRWTSSKPGLESRALPGAPAPAASQTLRLFQMKELTRRFAAVEHDGPARRRTQIRLMPRPLDRYDDAASGLRDGAIFGFAMGTNPDVLLVLEAGGRGDAPPAWQYAVGRLGGAELTVSLDGQPVWTEGGANPPAELETYMNRRIAEGSEPG
jgi:hypothetical protein